MKIAVLSSHTPSLFWFRMDMMKSFQTLGHEVIAIGDEPTDAWGKVFEENDIKYFAADIKRNGMNPFDEIKAVKSLRRILKAEMPDKIFTYQAKTIIYGSIAANQLGINEIYPLIAGLGSVFLGNSFRMTVVAHILKIEYRLALKNAAKVFFQNSDDIDFFVKEHLLSKDKIVKIHGSGVNLDRFKPQTLPDKAAFLCISRLIRDKGVLEYLDAARIVKSQNPTVRFLLVGPFDTNPSAISPELLQQYIDDGTVEYFGEQKDVRPFLEQCSIFVLPSYREGTPKTVLEAMASCKAVITTDAPGCRETVQDGVNGYLLPIKNVEAIVKKMNFLIANPHVVKNMAEAGRKMAEEKFDVKKVNSTICSTMDLY